MQQGRRAVWTIVALLAIPLAAGVYKVLVLGYSLADVLPQKQYEVTLEMAFDGHGGDARVRTFVPVTDERQEIGQEANLSPGLHFASRQDGLNRAATWSGDQVDDGARIRYAFAAQTRPVRFELDPALAVSPAYPASVAPFLRPEPEIQVDHPEIGAALERIGAQRGPLVERLRRIQDFTAALVPKPFKGTTDALTALRLGEASCNGKSRLFVALARAAGIPARLVGGLILAAGESRTSHQWVEVYIAGHWVPFCPTNRHFAEIPERYLALYRGDEALFRHTADVNFDYRFATTIRMVPSSRAREGFSVLNVWALFERLGLSFALLRTVLMLPIGALVVVFFRNVIGMPTFGTFLPALIAAAASETGPWWGLAGVVIVVLAVAAVRGAFHKLELLHSPSLAILLAAVTVSLLATSLLAERVGLSQLAHITLFPIAVLAIAAERFYLALTEQGPRDALAELAGTVVVMLACYVVMNSLALQILVIGFPEVLLAVVAADVWLGRWVGVRLSEYLRFRSVLAP